MPSSCRLGSIGIDHDRVSADLERVESGGYFDSYDEFVCGSWRTCMLWNETGRPNDLLVHNYAGAATATEWATALPYVRSVMSDNFDLSRLRFARLTRLTPGTVVVPHRDYVELDRDLVRVHVPLQTDPAAYAAEEETVYHMAEGEVWFLDATRTHSVGNFSNMTRVHLLLDFAAETDLGSVFHGETGSRHIPTDSVVPRRRVRLDEPAAFAALAAIMDMANFKDIVAMLVRRYFVADLPIHDVFVWLGDIAVATGDDELISRANWLEKHSVSSR